MASRVSGMRAWMNIDDFEPSADPVRGIFLDLKRLWSRYTPRLCKHQLV